MRDTGLMVGAFYNPHLGAELAKADGIDHLAMADPPAATDPWWPAIRERYTLLLHDYLGQLSEPLDERSIARARALAELYRSPWGAAHFQCLPTVARAAQAPRPRDAHKHPHPRPPAPLHRGVPGPLRAQRPRSEGPPGPAARHG